MKLSEIAAITGSEVSVEFAEVEIGNVASFDRADSGSLVFAGDGAALERALKCGAGAVLSVANVDRRAVLKVDDPRYWFSVIAGRLNTGVGEGIHESAVIGVGVKLGSGVSVGARAVIGDGVVVGDGCRVGPGVTIYSGTSIGARVVVQAGAVLGSAGFGYARSKAGEWVLFPQQGELVIEDDVEIGANTTIDRGALEETRIGKGTKIDNLVHIGHNCRIGKNVVIAAQTGISGSSVVEDGAILGGQVGIGEHATVGEGVILGGGAGVLSHKKVFGKGQVFWGRPARPLKEYLRSLARLNAEKK